MIISCRGPRRLRRYAGLEQGYVPLARQAEALLRAGLSQDRLLGPWRQAVLEDLDNGPRLLAAVGDLIEERRITGTAQAFAELRRQLADYDDFLRSRLLPRCRDHFPLPAELYAARLARHGVELPAGSGVAAPVPASAPGAGRSRTRHSSRSLRRELVPS